MIVVDPVAVEGQGGEAEEEHVVGKDGPSPGSRVGGLDRAAERGAGLRVAVAEMLVLVCGGRVRRDAGPRRRRGPAEWGGSCAGARTSAPPRAPASPRCARRPRSAR